MTHFEIQRTFSARHHGHSLRTGLIDRTEFTVWYLTVRRESRKCRCASSLQTETIALASFKYGKTTTI